MNNVKINKGLLVEISEFLRLNDMGGVDEFINKLVKDSFMVVKYGDLKPNNINDGVKIKEEVKLEEVPTKYNLEKRDIYDE
jgi:hypothetical protein